MKIGLILKEDEDIVDMFFLFHEDGRYEVLDDKLGIRDLREMRLDEALQILNDDEEVDEVLFY